MTPQQYSILMTVYAKEQAPFLKEAIDSMLSQTIKPSEFVVICDGPLTKALDQILANASKQNPDLFKIVRLPKNVGLGPALARGIKECTNELIMRMDSDDYSTPDRAKKQLNAFQEDYALDIVGSNCAEFNDSIKNIKCHVVLPENDTDIKKFSRKRCPFRHSAIMYKKSAVIRAGNYREYYLFEDYDIYVRMIETGAKCKNLQENLTYVRVSDDFYKRRGGLKYAKSILKFKNEQLSSGFYSFTDYLKSTPPHIAVCLMPNFARNLVYKRLLRS